MPAVSSANVLHQNACPPPWSINEMGISVDTLSNHSRLGFSLSNNLWATMRPSPILILVSTGSRFLAVPEYQLISPEPDPKLDSPKYHRR